MLTIILLIIMLLILFVGYPIEIIRACFPKCEMCGQRYHRDWKLPDKTVKYCPAWKKITKRIGAKNLIDFHAKIK